MYPYSNYKEIDKPVNNKCVFLETDETREIEVQNAINIFCEENKIEKDKLKENKEKLKEIIVLLREIYKISFRKISIELNIGRETIRKMYRK